MKIKFILLFTCIIFSNGSLWSTDSFTIRDEQGNGELIYPQLIKEGPDGNIYISDQKDYFIKVYSRIGKFLHRMGGKGEGPGLMKRMGGFGFYTNRNLLFFTEYFSGHKWITNMSLNGKFVGVFNLNIKKRYGLLNTISLPKNNYISEINYIGKIKRKSDYFEYRHLGAVVLIDKNGILKRDILKWEYIQSISTIGDGANIPIPFVPKSLWVNLNDRIYFADGLCKKIKIFDLMGKNIGETDTPLSAPEKVTDEDLKIWRQKIKGSFSQRDKTWFQRFGRVVDRYKKPIYNLKPNISEMNITVKGNILVGGVRKTGEGKTKFWLFTPSGNVITSISANIWDISITKSFIFFKSKDEDENTIVNCLTRKRSEKEDLLRVLKQLK